MSTTAAVPILKRYGMAPVPVRPRAGTFATLANRDFRFLLGGTMAVNFGAWVQMIAQGWLVLELTGSAVALGMIAFARGLAMLAASPVGGLLADRFDRRTLINAATGASALSASALAMLVVSGQVEVWQLFLLGVVDGVAVSVNQPARSALVYDIVGPRDVTNAVALQSMGMNITRLIGPSLGGVLIGVAGAGACFAVQAGVYVLSVLLSLPVQTAPAQPVEETSLAESVLGGFAHARRERPLLLLLVAAALPSLLVYPYTSFMPLFARQVLHADAFWFGVLVSAVGVGSIGGAMVAARKAATFPHKGAAMLGLLALYMVMVGLFALSSWYAVSYALLVVAGFANAINLTLNSSLLQLATADEYRGRVSGLHFMTFGLQPFGSLALGALVAVAGLQPSMELFCFVGTGLALALWAGSPRLRAM